MEWQPIEGFEDFYKINRDGVIRSLERVRTSVNRYGPYTAIIPPRIMKQKLDKDGYPVINLTDASGKNYLRRVGRLVAIAFIPNPENKPQVNHMFGDKTDSRNVEWCTASENQQHAYRNGFHALCKYRCPVTGRMQPQESAG